MKNKKAIVTGGTSGIGLAITRKFLCQGIDVIFTGTRKTPPSIVGEDEKSKGSYHYFSGDLSQSVNVKKLFDFSKEIFLSSPDIVVINAGIGLSGTVITSDPSRWMELFEVNCLATLYQMREAATRMIESIKIGSEKPLSKDIVVISSVAGIVVSEKNPVYGSTKFALSSLAESLRKEICGDYIRVSVLEPGFIKSNFQKRAGYDLEEFSASEKAFGPFLVPEDIAEIVAFTVEQPFHVNLSNLTIRPTRQKV